MQAKVKKQDNKLFILIPQNIVDELSLKEGDTIDIHFGEAPKIRSIYNLEDLLAQITDENKHGEIGFDK